ncbi:MAG: RIP metalloprotease RseP [Candidatus Omnitrophica bacterium]|nr:RIP metalloprotease RseP [Candidatus Omnitrophota bacterium]
MVSLFNYIYVAVAVVLLFGASVFVHEFGHFLMARHRGLKIEAFAIGFGPKIMSWTRNGIEYAWRWIPAGGFVKLPQMMTAEVLEGSGAPAGEAIPPISPWSKILVAFAGPFMNLVFAFVIATVIYFVGLPVLVNPSIIGYVPPDSPEAKMGIRAGDRIVEVDGKPVTSWQEVQMTTVLARTNVIPVVIQRDNHRTTYHLTAAVNPMLGWKMLDLEPRDHPEIIEVLPDSPAQKVGLKSKDAIRSFAGVPIASREQLIGLIQKRAGKPSHIRIERNGKELTMTITPRLDPTTKTGRIGVDLGNRSTNLYQVQWPGPLPWDQIAGVWNQTIDTLSALIHSKQTGVRPKDLSGPVGIISMLAVQVNTDYRLALKFLVLLNVSLAILNLLPVPVLDGGHILLALIERVRRRPLSPRLVEYTTTVFAILLISFMLYVTFFDITRWSLFRSLFKQPSQVENVENGSHSPAPAPEPSPAPAPAHSTP